MNVITVQCLHSIGTGLTVNVPSLMCCSPVVCESCLSSCCPESPSIVIPVGVTMSEMEVAPETGDDNRPQVPLPSVPLGDLLGTIREAVQAEVNIAVACLVAQQQPTPTPPMHPPSVPQASPVISTNPTRSCHILADYSRGPHTRS